MEQEDRIDIYTIPPNFAEEGTLLAFIGTFFQYVKQRRYLASICDY